MAKITAWVSRVYEDQGHDPEIDVFKSVCGKERLKDGDLAALAGLSPSTVKNLRSGQTRRPQHATFAKMAGAMGYKYGLERDHTPDYENEIPFAREQFKAHKAQLAKAREPTVRKKKKAKK